MDIHAYIQTVTAWAVTSGLRILLILAAAFILFRLYQALVGRAFGRLLRDQQDQETVKRMHTLGGICRMGGGIAIAVVALSIVLGEFGVQLGPILAAAGVLGLAVGFGAQHLVQDIINGFFILFDNQIRVGDVVSIGDKGGLVERVNLRLVVLRDLDGSVHYIRNSQISLVTNMTTDFSFALFDIGVSYDADIDRVFAVLQEITEEMRGEAQFQNDMLEPMEILGLDRFADSALMIKARIKTRPIRQWAVGREFNRRMKSRFQAEGIEIPYPQRTLHFPKGVFLAAGEAHGGQQRASGEA